MCSNMIYISLELLLVQWTNQSIKITTTTTTTTAAAATTTSSTLSMIFKYNYIESPVVV